jgi:membrane fusion protein, copper/silver efflux system
MLKKYLDKLKPYLDKLKPLLQVAQEKGTHFYRHADVVFKKYWAQPRVRLASYLVIALIVGVNIGKMIAPPSADTSTTKKVIDVEKNGIINVNLPGVILSPDSFEFITTAMGSVPVSLSVPGRLAFNSERLKVISARAPGRVERIYAFDGALVTTGQALADYFSPDYVSAQTEFILSSKMVAALKKNQTGGLYEDALSTAEAAANHLRVLGASNEDINRLRSTGQATSTFPIRAPIDGVVVKRAVDPGAYLNTGDILATIADPKNLWFLGNVYEQDIGKIKVGDTFRLKVESYPDREFIAKANYVGATIDPVTHALVVRCEVDNSDGLLKPEMFVSGTLEIGKTDAVVIPSSAVIQGRNVRYAIIKTGETAFSRRPIFGFALSPTEFAVTDGLEPRQTVVTKGATLLNQRFLREED